MATDLIDKITEITKELQTLPIETQINLLNEIRLRLHEVSPFKNEPVDLILWVKSESIGANNYNPNTVAPPELKLLELSIKEDGYTQPIVTWPTDDQYEVVDGFHRTHLGKESKEIKKRVHGYLPITLINNNRVDRGDRITSTIRHNRARGKHQISAMSEIIQELARRNWSDSKIATKLGMESDEVLRLKQIRGIAELFANQDFSEAWEVESCL